MMSMAESNVTFLPPISLYLLLLVNLDILVYCLGRCHYLLKWKLNLLANARKSICSLDSNSPRFCSCKPTYYYLCKNIIIKNIFWQWLILQLEYTNICQGVYFFVDFHLPIKTYLLASVYNLHWSDQTSFSWLL